MNKRSDNSLNAVFSALADPTRRSILESLSEGHAQVSELAKPFDMSLPAISKHLRILEEAGLIIRERDGRFHRMHLQSKPLKEAAAWLEHYRTFWNARFDALDVFLQKTKK